MGKQTTAEALCRELGRRLLVVDGERLLNAEELAFETAVRLIMREALLQDAVLYWDGFDSLLADERLAWRIVLLRALEEQPGLAILAGNSPWEPADVFQTRPFVRVEFPRPAYRERLRLWQASLDGARRLRMATPTCRRWPASSASAAARSAMRRPRRATWPAGATRTAAA